MHSVERLKENAKTQPSKGAGQLSPHKTRPMPTQLKMQNLAHANSALFKFLNRQVVPHFRGIEVCVFYHLSNLLQDSPQESSILTRLCILNLIMVNSADTNDKLQIVISRKRPRCYSQYTKSSNEHTRKFAT